MKNNKQIYEFIHSECEKPAFYYDHMPVKGEIISHENAILLNGKKPNKFEQIICGSCSKQITWRQLTSNNLKLLKTQ